MKLVPIIITSILYSLTMYLFGVIGYIPGGLATGITCILCYGLSLLFCRVFKSSLMKKPSAEASFESVSAAGAETHTEPHSEPVNDSNETYYLMESANGKLIRVPESKLDAFQEAQESGLADSPLTDAERRLVNKIAKNIYHPEESESQQEDRCPANNKAPHSNSVSGTVSKSVPNWLLMLSIILAVMFAITIVQNISLHQRLNASEEEILQLSSDSDTAYDRGYYAGKRDGESEMYEKGYDSGHSKGYAQGFSDGSDHGYSEGYWQGYSSAVVDYADSDTQLIFTIIMIDEFEKHGTDAYPILYEWTKQWRKDHFGR